MRFHAQISQGKQKSSEKEILFTWQRTEDIHYKRTQSGRLLIRNYVWTKGTKREFFPCNFCRELSSTCIVNCCSMDLNYIYLLARQHLIYFSLVKCAGIFREGWLDIQLNKFSSYFERLSWEDSNRVSNVQDNSHLQSSSNPTIYLLFDISSLRKRIWILGVSH